MRRKRATPLKTATIPSLRVAPALRNAAENVLPDAQSLSSFVEQSIRESAGRCSASSSPGGFVARDEAKKSGKYIPADVVPGKLEKMLANAKKKSTARGSASAFASRHVQRLVHTKHSQVCAMCAACVSCER